MTSQFVLYIRKRGIYNHQPNSFFIVGVSPSTKPRRKGVKKMALSDEEKIGSVRSAVDLAIVGDNISDIAAFTLEKHEFKNDTTLSAEVREAGDARIKEVLWKRVEELKKRRMQILAEMFTLAETTLEEVLNKGK